MPLMNLKSGQQGILKEINWGDKLKHKLQEMGLTPGTPVSMITNGKRGPVILDVRGSRLALGRGIVSKINVDML